MFKGFMLGLAAWVLLCATWATAAANEQVEKDIVSAVQANMPQALATLEQAVNINSGTMNFEGVRKVSDLFSNELDALGFKTNWVDGADFGRAGHLVASHGTHNADGKKRPKILMIGHLDTVFAKSDAFQTFEPQEGGNIKGPGIADMKGGDVIMIAAIRALHTAGVLDDVSIKIVMTGDEERSGKPLAKSKQALVDAAIWADIALGFENGDGDIKTAVIARRGSVNWSLEVTGKASHSSQIFTDKVGYGAILEAARILGEFQSYITTIPNLTFNPGRIAGGSRIEDDMNTSTSTAFGKTNVVAQTLKVSGGIRAMSPQQLAMAKTKMFEIAADNLPHTSAVLKFKDGYPAMAPTQSNKDLLAMYNDISLSLGYGAVLPVNPRNAGAADISFSAGYVDAALDGLGMMGSAGHTKNETADISSFKKNTEKAALLIYRLSLDNK